MLKLLLRTALATAALAVLPAATASAGVLVADAPNCDAQPLSQPFAPWLDPSWYTPLAGGSFENGASGWTLTGGAAVVDGNEPWAVSGAGRRSLRIPAGGSATSPTICVGLDHPTVRFFVRRDGGSVLSTLGVAVRVELADGSVVTLPTISVVDGGNGWSVTLPGVVVANLLPLLPGARTPIQFRFVPVLGGTWTIDDVYVDPWRAR